MIRTLSKRRYLFRKSKNEKNEELLQILETFGKEKTFIMFELNSKSSAEFTVKALMRAFNTVYESALRDAVNCIRNFSANESSSAKGVDEFTEEEAELLADLLNRQQIKQPGVNGQTWKSIVDKLRPLLADDIDSSHNVELITNNEVQSGKIVSVKEVEGKKIVEMEMGDKK